MGLSETNILAFPCPPQTPSSILVLMDGQSALMPSAEAKSVIEPCTTLLAAARSCGVAVAHCFHRQEAGMNSQATFRVGIDSLRPRPDEMIFERSEASCYSNPTFVAFMRRLARPNLILAGWNLNKSGLATCIDAHNFGHSTCIIVDAFSCGTLPANVTRQGIMTLVGRVASIATCFATVSHWQEEQQAEFLEMTAGFML